MLAHGVAPHKSKGKPHTINHQAAFMHLVIDRMRLPFSRELCQCSTT